MSILPITRLPAMSSFCYKGQHVHSINRAVFLFWFERKPVLVMYRALPPVLCEMSQLMLCGVKLSLLLTYMYLVVNPPIRGSVMLPWSSVVYFVIRCVCLHYNVIMILAIFSF